MDSFELCRAASEKANWSFDVSLGNLELDFSRRFLPSRLCGQEAPDWLSPQGRNLLNHIRGFSYAHLFLFVEEFIIQQTCNSATTFVHVDREALSALLKFTDEETKHQRMFLLVKNLVEAGLGFRPNELEGKESIARAICLHSPIAVYLLTLMIEWFTQRHYVECFKEAEADLDPGFVKVFRLHWTEEAQHARIDALLLRGLAQELSREELVTGFEEFVALTSVLDGLVGQQDALDIQTLETALGEDLTAHQRAELLGTLRKESRWTFLVSGLEHRSFQAVYNELLPDDRFAIEAVIEALQDQAN
jgi:hypothetical protein